MEELLQALREFDALRDQGDTAKCDHVTVRKTPRKEPAFASAEALTGLSPFLQSALRANGINELYAHQAEAIGRAMQGENVVLEAPPASGKTLCFLVPIIQRLLAERDSHALLLYPMKALSNDQRRQIDGLASALGSTSRRIDSWPFDGDTETEHRKLLKNNPPAILLTNPEMLHYSFLGWSDQWEKFLRKLRFIVVDEIHEYRGYFGTNMALLLRRF